MPKPAPYYTAQCSSKWLPAATSYEKPIRFYSTIIWQFPYPERMKWICRSEVTEDHPEVCGPVSLIPWANLVMAFISTHVL